MSFAVDLANQILPENKRRDRFAQLLVSLSLAATATALVAGGMNSLYGYSDLALKIYLASATFPLVLLLLRLNLPTLLAGNYLAANIFAQTVLLSADAAVGCVVLIALAAGVALLAGMSSRFWLVVIVARCLYIAFTSSDETASATAAVSAVMASMVFFIVQLSERSRARLSLRANNRAQITSQQEAIIDEIVQRYFDAVLQLSGNDIFNVSRSIEGLLGYTPDQFIDQPLAYYLHPDEPDISLELKPEKPPIRRVLRLRHADGRWVWVELWGVPGILRGHPNHCMVVLRDYEAERKVSDQLTQAQRLESMGSMAAAVAHDFNNMLTVIMGIADELPEGDARREIRRVAGNAANLTNKLLTFGHGQRATSEIHDLSHVMQEQSTLLRHTLDSRYVVVESYVDEPLLVRIEVSQFEQVLMNLVNNAREAMPEGGELEISLLSVEIEEAPSGDGKVGQKAQQDHHKEGHYALLEVQDSGVGIDADTLAKVFDPFFTTKPGANNNGLGLSSCYGIVSQYGGFINIDSTVGAGTSVKVYLPIAETRDYEPTLDLIDNEVSIMIIDDDPGVVRVVRNALTRAGYSVRGFTDVSAAMDAFNPARVSLVISDVVMPGLSGADLVRQLRQRAPHMPVLFISGFTNEELDSWATDAYTSYLAKPFRGEEVVQRAEQLLNSGRARQQMPG